MNRNQIDSPKTVIECFDVDMELSEGGLQLIPGDAVSLNKIFRKPLLIPSDPVQESDILSDAKDNSVEQLELRAYQVELAAPAIEGKNTIIVAPTGSGKTWVATHIIKNHLIANQSKTPFGPKVVFLVPTVPLVSQQTDVLKRYLRDRWEIGSFTGGDTDVPRGCMIKENHITVTTPQCFINTLEDQDPLGKVELETLSLLLFDECHHCDEKHPYMKAMIRYLDLKLENRSNLPQIVGLTASLGVGKKTTKLDEAKEHIIKMGAHFDSHTFSTVSVHKSELDATVTRPTDEFIGVESSHSSTQFAYLVTEMMSDVEILIQSSLESAIKEVFGKTPSLVISSESPWPKESEAYCCWVNTLLGRLPELNDGSKKRDLIACLQYLKIFQISLEMQAHLSMKDATDWLVMRMEEKERKHADHEGMEKQLLGLWIDLKTNLEGIPSSQATQPNPLLRGLLATLKREFEEKPDSRGILFVKTRDLTTALKNTIDNHSDLKYLQPGILTSINAQGEKGGQSELEQKQALVKFRDGTSKLLIATTVAEEGLDIEKCNLVIKYNHVTNEIAMVQKRGRGRALGSKSILLALKHGVIEKERINAIRETLMEEAIISLKANGEEYIQTEVTKIQLMEREEREIEALLRDRRMAAASENRYPLKCIKCNAFICYSTDVRRIQESHYVVINPDVWDKTVAEPLGQATQNHFEMSVAGKLSCKICREDLGNVLKYSKVFLPSLKATSFIVGKLDGSGNKERKTKWKKVEKYYFPVEKDVSRKELVAMHTKLAPGVVAQLDAYTKKTSE